MVRFADLRYIEVEFMIDDQQGLKIPNTAIVEKEFYLIPKAYLVEQDGDQGFMKEIYDKDGGASVEFLKMTIYYEDDDYYYIDPMESDYTTGKHEIAHWDLSGAARFTGTCSGWKYRCVERCL